MGPDEYHDAFRARTTECVLRGGPCRWEGTCAVHDVWAAGWKH
jgi:hypothetical protein